MKPSAAFFIFAVVNPILILFFQNCSVTPLSEVKEKHKLSPETVQAQQNNLNSAESLSKLRKEPK